LQNFKGLVVIDEAILIFLKDSWINELDEYPFDYYANAFKSIWFSWPDWEFVMFWRGYYNIKMNHHQCKRISQKS
jgi:hypothetical protein